MTNLSRGEIKRYLIFVAKGGDMNELERTLDVFDSCLDLVILTELLPNLSKIRHRKLRRKIKIKILDLIDQTILEPIMASL